MTDLELIIYLSEVIWKLSLYAGDDEHFAVMEEELRKRNIDPEDIFVY